MRSLIITQLIYFCAAKFLLLAAAASPEKGMEKHNLLRSLNEYSKQSQRGLGGCVPNFYADGQCDLSNCSADCTWDGGDCKPAQCNGYASSGSGNTTPSSTSSQTDDQYYNNDANVDASAPPTLNKATCRRAGGKPRKVNDGYCDQSNNIAQCNYDGNDCTNNSNSNQESTTTANGGTSTGQTNDKYYDYNANGDTSAPPTLNKVACRKAGGKPRKVNDGYCDQSNNIAQCSYDGNDCANDSNLNQESTNTANKVSSNYYGNSQPAASGTGGGSTDQYWTDLHNEVRRYYHGKYGYSFVNLVWSNDLAQSSQSYANVLASSPCDQYDHDPNNPYGENLAVMWESNDPSGENSRIKRVMDAWTYDEEIKNTALPYQEGSGHWTQVIWRATKYVGCATAFRSSESCHVLVCRYVTPGNCARGVNTWLADTMQDTTRCEPQCPPTEGCFWQQSS